MEVADSGDVSTRCNWFPIAVGKWFLRGYLGPETLWNSFSVVLPMWRREPRDRPERGSEATDAVGRGQAFEAAVSGAKVRVLDESGRCVCCRQLVPLDDGTQIELVDVPLEGGEMVVAIWQAIARLPIDLRAVLLLRDVYGLSYAEIGDVLEVSLPTVRWRIFESRERLMFALSPGHRPS